jgi:hypothetical protein
MRFMAVAGLMLATPLALAGTIGFSVSFTGDNVSISNTGTDTGYQLSVWTLTPSDTWQPLQIISGNVGYLPPGQSLTGRRTSSATATGLGRGDPLLVLLHDQAGSLITQLAWRQPPAPSPHPLPVERIGRKIGVAAGGSGMVATYAIVVPYEGIAQLAHHLSASITPPSPQRHPWAAGTPLMIDTGAGKGGVWLVHESDLGDLQLQVVPDGVEHGREQVPVWLNWARHDLMALAVALGCVGALVLLAGFFWPLHRHQQGRTRAGKFR